MDYKKYQQFSKTEEAELYRRMKAGDEAARQLLIESQLAWIRRIVLRMAGKLGVKDIEDAESAAQLRFIEILDRKFDPERGQLTTLVGFALPRFLSRWWNQNYLIRPPMSPPGKCADPEAIEASKRVFSIDPSIDRKSDRSGHTNKDDLVRKMREVAYNDPDHGERLDREERAERLRKTICKIPDPRSRKILRLRMKGESLQTVGDKFGISKERVRQIQRKCHEFIRQKHPEWWK